MLQFLQTGKMLYVLAAICGLGIMSKLVAGNLYKRIIKETGNMALTKDRNLRSLKQKMENIFLINHGIRNAGAYIEKQIYGFRFMGMSLDGWDNLLMQAMILCFLVGGAAAFGAYWYRCDPYYIVLYGTAGILLGLSLVFVENGVNTAAKRQQLADCLVDYVENSPHFYKNVDKIAETSDLKEKTGAFSTSAKQRVHAVGRKESAAAELTAGEARVQEKGKNSLNERQNGRLSVLSRRKESEADIKPKEKGAGKEDELSKSIDYLRESLEQIAASRERARTEPGGDALMEPGTGGAERPRKELRPEDLKVLGELLQEYLT